MSEFYHKYHFLNENLEYFVKNFLKEIFVIVQIYKQIILSYYI